MKAKSLFTAAAGVSILFGLTMVSVTTSFAAGTYDLVILDGRVMDPETKLDKVRNVGVKDGKIAVITSDQIQGRKTIDAKNHVVAPGFIDMLFSGQEGAADG